MINEPCATVTAKTMRTVTFSQSTYTHTCIRATLDKSGTLPHACPLSTLVISIIVRPSVPPYIILIIIIHLCEKLEHTRARASFVFTCTYVHQFFHFVRACHIPAYIRTLYAPRERERHANVAWRRVYLAHTIWMWRPRLHARSGHVALAELKRTCEDVCAIYATLLFASMCVALVLGW